MSFSRDTIRRVFVGVAATPKGNYTNCKSRTQVRKCENSTRVVFSRSPGTEIYSSFDTSLGSFTGEDGVLIPRIPPIIPLILVIRACSTHISHTISFHSFWSQTPTQRTTRQRTTPPSQTDTNSPQVSASISLLNVEMLNSYYCTCTQSSFQVLFLFAGSADLC